jgi:hypothetical protein
MPKPHEIDRTVDMGHISREEAVRRIHAATPQSIVGGTMKVYDQKIAGNVQTAIAAVPFYPMRVGSAMAKTFMPIVGRGVGAVLDWGAEQMERGYGGNIRKVNDRDGATLEMRDQPLGLSGSGRLSVHRMANGDEGDEETGDYSPFFVNPIHKILFRVPR